MITGIIGAMEQEVAALKDRMNNVELTKKATMEFCKGSLHGADVVVVRSGIGKVNAAVCAQILVDEFDVGVIINTGVAGSLKKEIDIGDIVLSADTLQHDMDAMEFGYAPGIIPQMDESVFKGDERLIAIARQVCNEGLPQINVFEGRVVSGDQFVADKETKDRIASLFGGDCTEMEGAAIAQAAYLNNIPFLIIRAISDKADDSAHMDYPAFEKMAAENSIKLLEGMIRKIGERKS